MILTLDIGNTIAKYGLFRDMALLETGLLSGPDELAKLVKEKNVSRIIAASVAADPEPFQKAVNPLPFLVLSAETPVPIRINYDTPLTLGADRLAAVCGAAYLLPGQDVLVIDAGTCITTDLLRADGSYQGGSISPGLDMRFKALHTFTKRLPLISKETEAALTGTSTETSIRSGVINGTVAEVQGIVVAYRKEFRDLPVILCGGDSQFFETKIDTPIFAVPELVLIGLAAILRSLDV